MFLCLLLCLANFSVVANAAEAENLVNSDLTTWEKYVPDSFYGTAEVVLSKGNSGAYYVSCGTEAKHCLIYDLSDLQIDTSYTFSFLIYDNDTTRLFFQDYDLSVSVGSLDSGFLVETEPFINYVITSSNYKNFTSELFKLSFKLDSYVGTPCIILHMSPKSSSVDYQRGFYIKDIQLLSNSSATDEKLDGVLGWLQELWDSITEGFSNLAADFKQGVNNLTSELQVTWQQITSKIEQIKDNLVGEIANSWQQTVSKIEQVKNNIIDSVSGFFSDLGAKIENKFNEIKTAIHDFFVPPEGFFDTWKVKFNVMLENNLGFVYQAPNFVKEAVYVIKDIIDSSGNINIVFPSVEFDIAGTHVKLFDSVKVDFGFLETGIWATLYTMYKVILYAVLAFALVEFAVVTWERTMSN